MTKINGKFAPLTSELGNDERFIIKSTDLDKLLYLLIIYTCHMTNHQAPIDPKFYKIRYGLRSKSGQIAEALRRVRGMYPKLSWGDKALSLLNSPTYKIGNRLEREEEIERDTTASNKMVGFDSFWETYPKKVGRGAAEKSWAKISPGSVLLEQILKAVGSAKETEQWKKENGKYIPHPTTWLNQKRWLDVHEQPKKGYDIWKTKPVTIPK